MKIIVCNNTAETHFYDGDKYDECPHCKTLSKENNLKNVKSGKSNTFPKTGDALAYQKTHEGAWYKFLHKFIKRKNKEADDIQHSAEVVINEENEDINEDENKNDISQEPEKFPIDDKETKDRKTGETNGVLDFEAPSSKPHQEEQEEFIDDVFTPSTSLEKHSDLTFDEQSDMPNASSNKNNSDKTHSAFWIDGMEDVEPCAVGWLICIKGKYFGYHFPIYSGQSSVGRGESNRICIKDDKSVSFEKHSWIEYEPKKRVFTISAGEGSGLTYLNGEKVGKGKEEILSAYDKIEIGVGIYMFVPLCGENFTWEDYMEDR